MKKLILVALLALGVLPSLTSCKHLIGPVPASNDKPSGGDNPSGDSGASGDTGATN